MRSRALALGLVVTCALGITTSLQAATRHRKPTTNCIDPASDDKQLFDPKAAAVVCPKLKPKGKKKKRTLEKIPLPSPVNPSARDIMDLMSNTSAVDPILILAIVATESNFHSIARATGQGVGHYGLMQIALATARSVGFHGKATELYDWRVNVKYGARYLAYLQGRYRGDRDSIIAAYNAGSAFKRKGKRGGFVNQGYVNKVKKFYAVYHSLYVPVATVAKE